MDSAMPALDEWQSSEYASNLYKTSITFTITTANKSSAVLIHILKIVLNVLDIENR